MRDSCPHLPENGQAGKPSTDYSVAHGAAVHRGEPGAGDCGQRRTAVHVRVGRDRAGPRAPGGKHGDFPKNAGTGRQRDHEGDEAAASFRGSTREGHVVSRVSSTSTSTCGGGVLSLPHSPTRVFLPPWTQTGSQDRLAVVMRPPGLCHSERREESKSMTARRDSRRSIRILADGIGILHVGGALGRAFWILHSASLRSE